MPVNTSDLSFDNVELLEWFGSGPNAQFDESKCFNDDGSCSICGSDPFGSMGCGHYDRFVQRKLEAAKAAFEQTLPRYNP